LARLPGSTPRTRRGCPSSAGDRGGDGATGIACYPAQQDVLSRHRLGRRCRWQRDRGRPPAGHHRAGRHAYPLEPTRSCRRLAGAELPCKVSRASSRQTRRRASRKSILVGPCRALPERAGRPKVRPAVLRLAADRYLVKEDVGQCRRGACTISAAICSVLRYIPQDYSSSVAGLRDHTARKMIAAKSRAARLSQEQRSKSARVVDQCDWRRFIRA
jgi:hypothetical protein